jgi:hypothetical protein
MTEYPPMIEVCAVSATKGKVVHSYAIDKPRAEEVATTLFNNIKLLIRITIKKTLNHPAHY